MKGGRLRVTVVIPARNEEGQVRDAIRSARSAGADEVIVVDGASADATARIAAAEADRVVSAPAGRALQMNEGAAAASGEVLVFLHADTRLPAGALDHVREAVSKGAGGGAFRVRFAVSPGAGLYRRAFLWLTGRMIGVRARLFRAYTGDQAIFVRRDLFQEIGGYPPVPLMEDVILSRLLARRSKTALLRSRVKTSARRFEENGPLRTILLMWGLRAAHALGLSPSLCASAYSLLKRG